MDNLAQQQALVGKLTDQQIQHELQAPSQVVPTYLIMAEAMKRQNMRTPMGGNSGSSVIQQMAQGQGPQPAQRFANGGGVGGGSGIFGMMTPQETIAAQMSMIPQYLQATGMKAPGGISDYLPALQAQIGDPSQAYNEPVQGLRDELASDKKQALNNALIQAGLAMMANPGSNLLAGIGAGGMAGYNSFQKAQDAQHQLKSQLANAIISQANAKSQGQQKLLELASGQRGQDISMYTPAMNQAGDAARNAIQANIQGADLEGRDTMNQRDIASQKALEQMRVKAELQSAGISAGASKYAADAATARDQQEFKYKYGDDPTQARMDRLTTQLAEKFIPKIGTSIMKPGPDGKPTYAKYTSDDAIADAQKAAFLLLRGGGPPPAAAPNTPNSQRPPLTSFVK